jgi:alkylation response protein AidB-like acyl-CoA dehydrogenase
MASEIATELAEQADRALTDAADVAVLRSLEAGAWPAATWDAMAALGLNGALVAEDAGGVGLGFSAAWKPAPGRLPPGMAWPHSA